MKSITQFIGVFILTLILSGCEEERKAATELEYLKKAAQEINKIPSVSPAQWKLEEREAMEKYFRTLAFWIQDAEKASAGEGKALPSGTNCRSIFVELSKWRELTRQCQRGSLYLCPEEMRNYESLVARAGKFLPDCQGML